MAKKQQSLFNMKYLFYLLTPFFLLLNFSCSHQKVEKEAPEINEIKAGEKFTIMLPENHLENYYWKLSGNHDKTIIDYINAAWHGNEKGVYYHFTALRSGTDTLRLTQYKMQDSVKTVVYILKVVE
jgi:predicted secreted protein